MDRCDLNIDIVISNIHELEVLVYLGVGLMSCYSCRPPSRHSRLDREDVWSWSHTSDGRYSIKSAYYLLLEGLPAMGAPQGDTLRAIAMVWKL